MHDAMLPELIYIILVITLDPCIMQEVEQYKEQAEEVEQYGEQADGHPTRTSGQEQHDMEPLGPGDDTNNELSQDLRSSDSAAGKISLISMHVW